MAGTQLYSVDNMSVSKVLGSVSPLYSIPNFQRRYAWTDKEVGELLYDLYDEIKWTGDLEDEAPYFLGSVVVAGNEDTESELILDGQQRLVTISLLLASIRHLLIEQKYYGANEDIYELLVQKSKGRRRNRDNQIKIKLQKEDAEAYTSLIEDPTLCKSRELKGSLLARAVQKILTDVIGKYMKAALETGISKQEALLIMLDKVVELVMFVKITAPSESDAFRLFETLNDRGLALNAADLIKNRLLAKCSELRNLNEAVEAWRNLVEFVGEGEVVNFLRYYWIAFHGSVRKRDLYKAFEVHLRKLTPQQALIFIKDLRKAARNYNKIINPNHEKSGWDAATGAVLSRLLTYGARTCRSVLLVCAENKPNNMLSVAKACESITVRHSIVSTLSSNELEKSYARLSRAIRNDEDITEALSRELSKHALTDEEFAHNFSQIQIDRVTDTWRQVLTQLNEELSTGETKVKDAQSVHVEHVLPRNPSKRSLTEASLDREAASELAKMIGNLTLLSSSMNREISNGPFSVKQEVLATSEIALNKEIAKQTRWGEAEILERNRRLGQLATEVWPWPVC